MKLEIPDTVIRECVEAGVIQLTGTPRSADVRGEIVQRLTVHVGEYVLALVAKELKNRKMLTYKNHAQ